jgi:ketosteroid isomerase-like protein
MLLYTKGPPITLEMFDLIITAGDDVAFCHSLNRINGTTTSGGKLNMWVRATVCLGKIEGEWMVTHEHTSVPFNTGSGMASLDLTPDTR